MKLKWTDDKIAFIQALYDTHTYEEIAVKFNKKFKSKKTPNAIRKAHKRNEDVDVSKAGGYSSILVISDMHIPYHHPDMLCFLKAVKQKYKPDKIVCIGDEVDKHAMSFHDSDPDLPSAGDELQQSIIKLKEVINLFPEVDLIDSNHGSMHYRKGKHHGIPRKYLKGYNDVLDAPSGWRWTHDLRLSCSDGSMVYFHHGLKKNGLQVAQQMGMNFVQGHFHNDFCINYCSTPDKLLWNMTVGCLIDDDSYAFAYNKTTLGRPIIGLGLIIEGQPKLVPMLLDGNGRWIKKLN
jgi:predicted phosphodiesterase